MNRKANLVNNYFIQIYLTIIALLQSVALGNLVPHLISYFTSPKNSFFSVHTPPLLITLLIIFIVWHHYVYGIIYLRWFPNILDAIIPFVISITQSFLIAFVETQNAGDTIDQWIRSFAFFLFFGAGAYFAAALRHDAELFTNIMDRSASEAHKKNIWDFYSRAGASMILQFLFALMILLFHWDGLIWLSLVFFLLHIAISEHYHIRNIKPGFVKSVNDFKETD